MRTTWFVLAGIALLTNVGLAAATSREGTKREATTTAAAPGVIVPARANIFGAGHARPPAPGGGGAGILPTRILLPRGRDRFVRFTKVVGRVNPINWNDDWNGPGGDHVGPTDVTSYQGISGIVHRRNGMFLVGVFLTEARPSGKAPPRLDFSDRERISHLAPRIAQTFLIGNGEGRTFRVPPTASRLLLGFADGFLYEGAPGWYDNNSGGLVVTVRVTGS